MRPSWKIRRRIVNATLGFCAGCLVYLMVWGTDNSRLHETLAMGFFGVAISVIGSYIFGATWDDKNVMQVLGKDAYADQVASPPSEDSGQAPAKDAAE